MSRIIRIPMISTGEEKLSTIGPVRFPEKCIYCGEAMHSTADLEVKKKIVRSRKVGGKSYQVGYVVDASYYFAATLHVPYCEKHRAENEKNNAVLGYAVLLGALVGLAGSLYAWTTQPVLAALLWTAGLVFLCAGMGMVLSKYVLFRARKSLRDTFASGGLGIGVEPLGQREGVEIKLTNSEIAREFGQLNGLEVLSPPKIEYSYSRRFVFLLALLAVVAAICGSISIFTR